MSSRDRYYAIAKWRTEEGMTLSVAIPPTLSVEEARRHSGVIARHPEVIRSGVPVVIEHWPEGHWSQAHPLSYECPDRCNRLAPLRDVEAK